jgi:hypothetical protein
MASNDFAVAPSSDILKKSRLENILIRKSSLTGTIALVIVRVEIPLFFA